MASNRVVIKKTAAKELKTIGSRRDRERIVKRIEALARDPRPAGVEKLAGEGDKYRIRQGNYRILYEIQDAVLVVTIVRVADRKDVYRH